jgi:hypothetical protein
MWLLKKDSHFIFLAFITLVHFVPPQLPSPIKLQQQSSSVFKPFCLVPEAAAPTLELCFFLKALVSQGPALVKH